MTTAFVPARTVMNGKPVITIPAKTVLNLDSGFSHKLLCDGPTFSTGSACAYSCSFCYVPDLMRKSPHLVGVTQPHEAVVIRRAVPLDILRSQLLFANGSLRFPDPKDNRVVYASPLVDVAANMELVRETAAACKLILGLTHWHIRLLSKSNLLPQIATQLIEAVTDDVPWPVVSSEVRERMIFGVSTGTLDDGLARVFEEGTPLVSKRLASLHWLQDHGFRTFGMICPSLPQTDYPAFARAMHAAIRAERCEHVWGEVLNARGASMTRTIAALRTGGFTAEADQLARVAHDRVAWEDYARATFEAHAPLYRPGQLRFLQYVTSESKAWWHARRPSGAILL